MKALVYETAHALEDFAIACVDVAEPTVWDEDVLVEVRAIGINPGEAFIRSTRSAAPGGRVLLGFEFAGTVIARGEKVERFEVGDRVFGTGDVTRDGCWAERVAVDHRIIARMPGDLSFTEAASLPIGATTAWEAMFRDQDTLPAGVERVLVLGGAGGVGSLAIQLLKARTKAFVVATGSRSESKAWCRKMGADLVLDHTDDIADQLVAAAIPHVDMVVSTATTADRVGLITKVLRPFGHLSMVDGAPSLDVGTTMSKSISIHTEMVFARVTHGSAPERQGQILDAVAAMVAEGRTKPITTTALAGLGVDTMRRAHGLVETRRTIGKVVIDIRQLVG